MLDSMQSQPGHECKTRLDRWRHSRILTHEGSDPTFERYKCLQGAVEPLSIQGTADSFEQRYEIKVEGLWVFNGKKDVDLYFAGTKMRAKEEKSGGQLVGNHVDYLESPNQVTEPANR